jgi:hypothetical protein
MNDKVKQDENTSNPEGGANYTATMTANNIRVDQFDYLIGKVFRHLELLGLTDRQLTALKASLREMFWDWYNSYVDNPSGYADPSKHARVEAGIEPRDT